MRFDTDGATRLRSAAGYGRAGGPRMECARNHADSRMSKMCERPSTPRICAASGSASLLATALTLALAVASPACVPQSATIVGYDWGKEQAHALALLSETARAALAGASDDLKAIPLNGKRVQVEIHAFSPGRWTEFLSHLRVMVPGLLAAHGAVVVPDGGEDVAGRSGDFDYRLVVSVDALGVDGLRTTGTDDTTLGFQLGVIVGGALSTIAGGFILAHGATWAPFEGPFRNEARQKVGTAMLISGAALAAGGAIWRAVDAPSRHRVRPQATVQLVLDLVPVRAGLPAASGRGKAVQLGCCAP